MPAQANANRVEIEGYAALFDKTDLAGDVIKPGAFADSINNLILTGCSGIKMLYQHAAEKPVGVWEEVYEDLTGLFVRGKVFLDIAQGADLYHLLRGKAIDGLSIGFKPERARKSKSGSRELLTIDLWEVSVVTFPMMPGARLTRLGEPGERLPRNLLTTA